MSQGATFDRRIGWLAVLGGGLLALAVQVAAPVGVPLYDGVVVTEPYRFLHPTGAEVGEPTSFSSTEPVTEGASPIIVAETGEIPPQAQLIAQSGAFELTPGATSLLVSITPIEPPAEPLEGSIAGNVYRFSVTDQAGQPLAVTDCDGCRSLLLRSPAGLDRASIMRFADGAWVDVETLHAGTAGLYQANATAMGDYAVIAGASPQPAHGVDPLILVGGGALLIWLLGLGVFVWRRTRPMPVPGSGQPTNRARIPSKRRKPPRPPAGSTR